MPKISVIIPCYNVEKYLEECLDSVVNQTFTDIEIICVNDGSTDNSLKILKKYETKDNRIKIINNIKNKGAGYARNCALKIAKGSYLAFIDGDDFYELTYLEELYNKAKETNADITICSAKMFDNKKNEHSEMPWALRNDFLPSKDLFNYKDISKFIFNFSQNWNWNKLFKHSFIKANKILFQEIYRTNDMLFTCKSLVLANTITTVNKSLINYRVKHGNSCQQSNGKYPLDFYYAFKALKDFLQQNGLYNTVQQSYINWALGGVVYNIKSISNKKIQAKLVKFFLNTGLKNLGLDEYTDFEIYDSNLKSDVYNLMFFRHNSFIENIFSIKNQIHGDTKHKVLTILGIKIKLKKRI